MILVIRRQWLNMWVREGNWWQRLWHRKVHLRWWLVESRLYEGASLDEAREIAKSFKENWPRSCNERPDVRIFVEQGD